MSLPIVPYYVLYDLDGDGVVTQSDVDTLAANIGGGPPPGVPLCRATTGSVISAGDAALADSIKDGFSPPIIVIWLTRPSTDLLVAPAGSIIPLTDAFEVLIRSEVDAIDAFSVPGGKPYVTGVSLRLLDDTVIENQVEFFGPQGLGFYGNTSGSNLFAQFRIASGWWKLHIDVVHGSNVTVLDYITLAQLDANQGLFSIDLAKNEFKTMVLQRGATTVSLPVPISEGTRKFKFSLSPFYHGLQQLEFGGLGLPSTDWSLPPQSTVPEYDLSLTRPINSNHIHPLSLCGQLPTTPVPITDSVALLGENAEVTICPSGRTAEFVCSDPKLIGVSFATLTEIANADLIGDYLDTISLASILEDVLKRWLDFSGFSDSFNFFLYREDSPILAFLDLSALGRSTYRIHVNLTVLENHPPQNWKDLIGPMPIWASFVHHWYRNQTTPTGPVPVGLALALTEHIGKYLGYNPFYFNEADLGSVLRTNQWVSAITTPSTSSAEKMEAVVLFLNNLFNQSIPPDVSANLVDAINNLSDLQVEGIVDEFVAIMAMYDVVETPPNTSDVILLRNWLVANVPDGYDTVIVPTSESEIDIINEKVPKGGEPVTASFLCDEVSNDNLLGLNDCFKLISTISDLRGEKRLLRTWSLPDVPSIFASLLGSDFLSTVKSRAESVLSSDSPLVSQSQLVQSYRVTRHRLLTSSFILPIEYTQKILAWPEPMSADAVRDLPMSFYDLVLPIDLGHLIDSYSTFAPDPVFPSVPDRLMVAGSQALFKADLLAGTTDLVLTVDREVVLTIYRYE